MTKLLMFIYALIMSILGIISMNPIDVMGWVLSGLWILSIMGLYLLPIKTKKDV